ncbi:MAG: (2Fe-2S)-binding protein [Pseudomonadota bacterium]
MFKRLADHSVSTVIVNIDGVDVKVPAGESVAAVVLVQGLGYCRTTPVSGAPRAPFCMMGVCFDCLMEIDGVPNRQACMVRVEQGMRISRQRGVGRSF